MKTLKNNILFLILLISFIPTIAHAKTVQFSMCFGDDGLYSITYDDAINTNVKKDQITFQAIKDGHIAYPEGISETEKEKYSFTASGIANKCYQEGDTIYSCPSNSDYDNYSIIKEYIGDNGTTDKISFYFNEATGKFNITIKDAFSNELYVRYVNDETNRNVDEKNAISYMGSFLTRSADGYYTISNIPSNTKIFLEFYLKNGKCSNSYLGYISFFTPNAFDYEVENPAISNPNSYGCNTVKNYRPSGMTNTEDINKFETVKKSYIYECYHTGKITYGKKLTLKQDIEDKLNKLYQMFNTYTSQGSSGNKICTDQYTSTKITHASTGSYYALTCTETYTAQGDHPKLVYAGDGFNYQATYTITRTCNITPVRTPTRKAQCTTHIDHTCSWPTRSGTGTGLDAGPNDKFDSCVYSCDGGKYSQNCINSCYSTVYQNDRNLSFVGELFSKIKNKIEFTSSTTFNGPNTGESCITDHGRNGNILRYCENGICDQACFSNWCGDHGGSCTFNSYKTPDGCSDDAEGEYQRELAAQQAELASLRESIKNIPVGEYTFKITDSYLKTDGGQPYVFTVNSKNDPAVSVKTNETTSSDGLTKKLIITVDLPLSYINKINGDVVYKTDSETKTAYRVNHKQSKFISLTNFDKNNYYNDDIHKYYTSIWSPNTNVVATKDGVQLIRTTDYNITVESSNVGEGNFTSNIDCYYGVYNNFYCEDPNDCPDSGPNDPGPYSNPEIDPTGIRWIYRVIDLEDVFPNNRNPRWNWTGTLNRSSHTVTGAAQFADSIYLKYNIDPIALTNEIEEKGYSIYDVKSDASEVDYEFVLTKENLQNIRSYNKNVRDYNEDGYQNYADYNMSCYVNSSGKEICTSRFLDNVNGNSGTETSANFITYSVPGYTIDTRKDIAGCNNSRNGICVEVGR